MQYKLSESSTTRRYYLKVTSNLRDDPSLASRMIDASEIEVINERTTVFG